MTNSAQDEWSLKRLAREAQLWLRLRGKGRAPGAGLVAIRASSPRGGGLPGAADEALRGRRWVPGSAAVASATERAGTEATGVGNGEPRTEPGGQQQTGCLHRPPTRPHVAP